MLIQGIKDSFACIQSNALTSYTKSHTIRKRLTKVFLFNAALALLGTYGPWYIFPGTLVFHFVCLIVTTIWMNDVSKKALVMYPVKLYNVSPHNYYLHKVSQIPFEILGHTVYKVLLLTSIQLTATFVDLLTFVPFWPRTLVSIMLLSLTYGFVAWDATLATAGYDVTARFAVIESNTTYFIGFGLPITIASVFWSSFFTNAAVYNFIGVWLSLSSIFVSERIPKLENRIYIPILKPYRRLLQCIVPALSNKIASFLSRKRKQQ
jgi:hypothetical protein